MEIIVVKKVPSKTEREKQLRDYYMSFIRDEEGVNETIINSFRNDANEVMQENSLYHKVYLENKLFEVK